MVSLGGQPPRRRERLRFPNGGLTARHRRGQGL